MMRHHVLALAVVAIALGCETQEAAAPHDDFRPLPFVIVITPGDTNFHQGGSLDYRAVSNPTGNLAWTVADTSIAIVLTQDAANGSATVVARRSGSTSVCANSVDTPAAKGCATLRINE